MLSSEVHYMKPKSISVQNKFTLPCMLAGCLAMCGCKAERVVEFEPNMVFAKSIEIQSGYPMQTALNQTQVALHRLFGTPTDPQLPELLKSADYADLLSLENIKAAGHVEGKVGLYEKHCATCHGVVGNGRGTTAALLDPYPRDYRAGKFKFKSTPRGSKPLREDLEYVIGHGIDGTSMKAIPELKENDIKVLTDYVIYLSIRGELERNLLRQAEDIDFEAGESLFDVSLESSSDAEKKEMFKEQLANVDDTLTDICESWLEAGERVKEVAAIPEGVPVPATRAELLAAKQSPDDSPLKKSIARGYEVFRTEAAACGKCHGKEGYGDGTNVDYDDWTKEWTIRIGIEPTDEKAQIPLVARGALPPRRTLARDFRLGLFRGGSEPERIYRRIAEGIDGTPMPAAAIPTEDIWHLVNFVRSFDSPPEQEGDAPATVAK
jgi:mono/diheme cytochrome c family protein